MRHVSRPTVEKRPDVVPFSHCLSSPFVQVCKVLVFVVEHCCSMLYILLVFDTDVTGFIRGGVLS